MTAWNVLIDGTIKAAGLSLRKMGRELGDGDYGPLTAAIKDTLKANIPNILSEWEDASAAHMSESWLRELMNAQANEMALKAIASLGWH